MSGQSSASPLEPGYRKLLSQGAFNGSVLDVHMLPRTAIREEKEVEPDLVAVQSLLSRKFPKIFQYAKSVHIFLSSLLFGDNKTYFLSCQAINEYLSYFGGIDIKAK